MIQSVFTIGAILTAVVVVISFFMANASTKESYKRYYPSIYLGIVGILLVLTGSVMERVDIMGAGLGGWGIAAIFASAIGLVITSVMDAYKNAEPDA